MYIYIHLFNIKILIRGEIKRRLRLLASWISPMTSTNSPLRGLIGHWTSDLPTYHAPLATPGSGPRPKTTVLNIERRCFYEAYRKVPLVGSNNNLSYLPHDGRTLDSIFNSLKWLPYVHLFICRSSFLSSQTLSHNEIDWIFAIHMPHISISTEFWDHYIHHYVIIIPQSKTYPRNTVLLRYICDVY